MYRYNLHPGSTCGKWTLEEGIAQIAALVNRALAETAGVTIVLESTAGQGSCIGHRFEHLADIIAQVWTGPFSNAQDGHRSDEL